MSRIFLKSAAVAFASLAVSLLLTLIVVPAMGFPINRTIWLTSTVCPLVLAWIASAYTFWQGERLKGAHRDLARAHAQLAAAHRRLSEKASRDDMTGMLNRESFFAALEATRFRPVDERVIPLTVSIGGVTCGEDAGVSDLMRVADRRLYQAKDRGRNLTILDRDVSEAA
ncbi:MAG: hypothetical protein E5Y59_16935 [Mesorhizobium sp.]|nr:MAG: hypothetical protein E5Y59_16935 [Mesorhizobium sp.]